MQGNGKAQACRPRHALDLRIEPGCGKSVECLQIGSGQWVERANRGGWKSGLIRSIHEFEPEEVEWRRDWPAIR